MRLHLLPHDAIENVFSHLSTTDILATASASPFLTLALTTHLHRFHLVFDRITKQHLLACPPNVASHIRHLSVSGKLSPNDLRRLAHVFTALHDISFSISTSLPSAVYYQFLDAIAPSLRRCAIEFCSGLTGDVVFDALATRCQNLHSLILRFTPHVHAPDIQPFLINVGHSLRVLELEDCIGVDDQVLFAVATYCHNLESLCVGGSEEVGDNGVIAIAQSPCASTLINLDLRSCMQVTDVGAFALATSCFALRSVNLWRVCVTSYGVRAVAEGLGVDLETLVIGDCIGVDDTALQSIADNCDSLVTLEMCGLKRITDSGIMALFDANRTGSLKLQDLTIDRCANITSQGVLAATGLWDATWESCSPCGSSCRTSKRKHSAYHQGDQNHGVEGVAQMDIGYGARFVERRLTRTRGPQRCGCGAWKSREMDSSQSKRYESYLRKLSAIDTRVESSTWKWIRDCRRDLELVADEFGLADDELPERNYYDHESWVTEVSGRCGDGDLSGLKGEVSDPGAREINIRKLRLLQDGSSDT